MPGMSRLFLDFSAGELGAFLPSASAASNWQQRPPLPAHWPELVELLAKQNPSPATAAAIAALSNGAGTVVTGQQVGLFGGPLFTPFKAATAIARARQATACGSPHQAIFWLATEDHDFEEIDHVTFPAGKALEKLQYPQGAEAASCPPRRPPRPRRARHAPHRASRRAARPLGRNRRSHRRLPARPHPRPGLRRFLFEDLRRPGPARPRRQQPRLPPPRRPRPARGHRTRRRAPRRPPRPQQRSLKPPAITPRSPSPSNRACSS